MKSNEIKSILFDSPSSPLIFDNQKEKLNWMKRIKESEGIQPLLAEIKEEATRLLNEREQELTFSLFQLFEQTGSRIEYERVYFAKRRRLNTFALMSLLEPENEDYVTELQNTIWSILNEYSWCLPAHLEATAETEFSFKEHSDLINHTIDLFAAETAFALSEIYMLVQDALPPLIIKRIHEEIDKRIFRPFLANKQGWETATHNWAAVCAGSIGSAALHLLHEEELIEIITRVLKAMDYYLQGFHDDGTCLEGYGYWQYGFGFYVYFADLVKKRTNGEIDLFQSEKVHQIALFQQKTFLFKNKVVNFSDAQPESSIFLGLSHYLHSVYPDVQVPEGGLRAPYIDDHCSRWAPAFRNLLWFNEQIIGKPWRQETYYLKESQWFISRQESENGSFAFAAKGGHNDEPHNHNDIGHFILLKNGEMLLKDLGCGLYHADYFGEKRYQFACNGSHGHSVPIINQQEQKAGPAYYANVVDVNVAEDAEVFTLDMTNAYDLQILKSLHREFTWKKSSSPKLVIKDSYHFLKKPDSLIERLIVPNVLIKETDKGIWLNGEEDCHISFDRELLAVSVKSFEFVDHFGNKQLNQMVDLHLHKLEEQACITIEFEWR